MLYLVLEKYWKQKSIKKNGFFKFSFIIKRKKKLKLYIFKLFNLYIINGNKYNKFKEIYKNNLLCLTFFFHSTFLSEFYFSQIFKNQT